MSGSVSDEKNWGFIKQVIGPVVDVEFPPDRLPGIYDAREIDDAERDMHVVTEVAQHIGESTVRSVAMGPTDGLVRGQLSAVR